MTEVTAVADWGSCEIRSIAAEVIEEDLEEEEEDHEMPASAAQQQQQHQQQQQRRRSVSNVSDRRRSLARDDSSAAGKRNGRLVAKMRQVDHAKWINADAKNGFVRVYRADSDRSVPVACTLETPAVRICQQLRLPTHCLHLLLAGNSLRRLDPFECPLSIQNNYLANIGFSELRRVQKIGPSLELRHLLQFVAGRPSGCRPFARPRLQAVIEVRDQDRMLAKWRRRLCDCTAPALTVFKGTDPSTVKTVLFLAQGQVRELQDGKKHEFCLQVTGIGPKGERCMLLSFKDQDVMDKWKVHIERIVSQKDQVADLSGSQLEVIPEPLFCLTQLRTLNLKRNCLRSRAAAEASGLRMKIGYLDDLAKLHHLTVLNLADNSLTTLPSSLCSLKSLVELNISSNQIPTLPSQISNLTRLEILHAHNNHLSTLPDTMSALTHLSMLVLAFNRFLEVPPVLAEMSKSNEDIIMSGNKISCISDRLAERLKAIKRINFRMNQLSLNGSSSLKLDRFMQLAYLDVRDNLIESLDLQCLSKLEYVCCERNRLCSLKLNGTALRTLLLSDNKLTSLDIEPIPLKMQFLDVKRNKLTYLPGWTGESEELVKLDASHNFLSELPRGLLSASCPKLSSLLLHHNVIHSLPEPVGDSSIEELQLHHNWISQLPHRMFQGMPRLKQLNVTKNRLTGLPPVGDAENSRLKELNLSFNQLDDAALRIISKFTRLRILRVSFNQLTNITDECVHELRFLTELNVSGNQLRSLPPALEQLEQLVTVKAHSNMLQELPDFRNMPKLRALDLGCNNLLTGSVRDLMEARVSFLDLSCNERMGMSMQDLSAVKNKGTIHTVNSAGTDLLLQSKTTGRGAGPFQFGLAESPGSRNKICVSVLKKMPYPTPDSGVFAMFDGGHNAEVPRQLQHNFCRALKEQLRQGGSEQQSMKYALLTCHRQLRALGQKLGASGAVLYLKRKAATWEAVTANAGNVEIVLAQQDKAFRLTRLFTAQRDRDEADRVFQSDGVITEDAKVNGCTDCTRLLGSAFLYPHVIPDPQLTQINLTEEDDAIIIANRNFWNFVSYDEAADEVKKLQHPVAAAKRLLDLAQAYGSTENISILVVKVQLAKGDTARWAIRQQQQQQQQLDTDSTDDYASLQASIQSIESATSEEWTQKRVLGYQKLKGQRTVEELEAQQRLLAGGGASATGRKFVKRGETAQHQLELEMQKRLTDEVKMEEVNNDLGEFVSSPESDSDSLGRNGNWTTLPRNSGGGARVTNLLSSANRSLIHSDAFGHEADRLSEITNSDLLLHQPRPDRIGDAGIDPDSESSLCDPDYESLPRGFFHRAPDFGHERMREETYLTDNRSLHSADRFGSQSVNGDAVYAEVQKPARSMPPATLVSMNGRGQFCDTGTEPESPGADLLTPSSTFSFPASKHALQPKPNLSLSQQAPLSASRGFEDQELVADIMSVASSASTVFVADRDEDTHL